MLPHSESRLSHRSAGLRTGIVALFACLAAAAAPAQQSAPPPAPPAARPAADTSQRRGEYKIGVNVNLVVLHATVLDKKGKRVDNLTQQDFRVYEDGAPQKLTVFSHADIPVTMGIIIDDSGSMRDKRPAVNAAALTFVKTSNPQDQVFVVNFNDSYYLDTPGNFAQNMEELKGALGKIDSRGGTALYDAVYASLDHMKLGNRDKKVVLVITDGEDNASRYSFEELLRYAQKSNAVVYCIGLLGDEEPGGLFKLHGGGAKRAAKALRELAQATGGQAYFPRTLDDVESTCTQIAHDIRNQYTLGYYPTNFKQDGTYRTVRVEAFDPQHHDHPLDVRTRAGYYAPKAPTPVPSTASTSGQ
jgi:Ca-activated chloride channel homolog